MLRNVGRRGDVEPARIAAWLADNGFATQEPVGQDRIDGGNVVAAADRWLIGMPLGATRAELDRLADVLADRSGRGAVGIPLAQARSRHPARLEGLDVVARAHAGGPVTLSQWMARPNPPPGRAHPGRGAGRCAPTARSSASTPIPSVACRSTTRPPAGVVRRRSGRDRGARDAGPHPLGCDDDLGDRAGADCRDTRAGRPSATLGSRSPQGDDLSFGAWG